MGPAIKSIKETARQIYRTRLTLEWLSANPGTPVDPSARVENSEAQPGRVSLCSHCMKVIACRNSSSNGGLLGYLFARFSQDQIQINFKGTSKKKTWIISINTNDSFLLASGGHLMLAPEHKLRLKDSKFNPPV